MELIHKKEELDNEITETQSRQIELDKTGNHNLISIAEEFRNLHKERQKLIVQWQDAVNTMNRRDKEIEEAQLRFAEVNKHKETREKKS